MSTSQLEKMANDIGDFFRGQSDRETAIEGIRNHINRFWTPRMKQKLLAQLERGEAHLDELPAEAMRHLSDPKNLPPEPPGGDAG
jgi:formate dehydrogenase subunit delta